VHRLVKLHQSGAADSPENSYLLVTKHLLTIGTHVAVISIDFPGRVSVSPGALANKSTYREKDMNTLAKSCLAAMTLLVAGMASADWSANLGWASEYHYRGIFQQRSSASGGVDFEQNGFYAGTWTVDVGEGLEVDGYFGYDGEVGDFDYGVGFTGYYYTGDFDDTYQEINLSGGYGLVTLDVALGQYENFTGPTQDYTYYALTMEKSGFYGRYAGFSQDFMGEYVELGYGATVAEFDFAIRIIFANDDLIGESDESAVFTIGKSFDF